MSETSDARLKRLTMRSMRRGIKEMDVILSGFARDHLDQMDDGGLRLYDALLSENDQDLYGWVIGTKAAPSQYSGLIDQIAVHCGARSD